MGSKIDVEKLFNDINNAARAAYAKSLVVLVQSRCLSLNLVKMSS